MSVRAECATCGKLVPVRRNGALREHYVYRAQADQLAAQLAELAADDDIAADLRILRRRVARHIAAGRCAP